MNKLPLNYKIKLNAKENRPISEFWSWAYSDILSNRNRGIFLESGKTVRNFLFGRSVKLSPDYLGKQPKVFTSLDLSK